MSGALGLGLGPRLRAAFAAPRAGRAALIPYLTGGHPDVETSHRLIDEVISAGADIIELGVPFSDPIADGPVVQRSTHEALTLGVTPEHVFELAAAHREHAPFVLLVYLNTVLARGPELFFSRAAEAGVEALVIPDLPLDEAVAAWIDPAGSHPREGPALAARAAGLGLALVPMATPTSTDERLDQAAAMAAVFVYCVTVTGVTGARRELGEELPALIARLRTRTATPLAAGFGISTPSQAASAAAMADGVIVGSALIDVASRGPDADEAVAAAGDFVRSMSAALEAV